MRAVELAVVDLFAEAIASVPVPDGPSSELVAARDIAVAKMLAVNPAAVDHLRRAILHGGGDRKDLVSRLTELTAQQVHDLRTAGLASTRQTVGEQVVTIMVRQLGRLFPQPLVDRIAEEFDDLSGPSGGQDEEPDVCARAPGPHAGSRKHASFRPDRACSRQCSSNPSLRAMGGF